MTAAKKKLSDRRARFALEYLKDGNATAAAARADGKKWVAILDFDVFCRLVGNEL